MSLEIPCPFCILNKANTQVCNVIVTFNKDGNASLKNVGGITEEQKLNLYYIVLSARQNKAIRVGQKLDKIEAGYECYIVRPLANTYKICFHTKDVNAEC